MRLPFCDHHICAFLAGYAKTHKPLDLAFSEYLRAHKSIGANDRRTIGSIIYDMIRWETLIDHFCYTGNYLDRLSSFRKISFQDIKDDLSIPEPARLGMSTFLYNKFYKHFGFEKGRELCRALNTQAPTTVRANLLKITREELFNSWTNEFGISLCKSAPNGIQFDKRTPLFALPEFKKGFFEVQDEGSQCVAALVKAKPGDHVLDYCSGSGGKTLAFAPQMEGKGQIYLNDNRPWVLLEAKKRLRRAGVQNVQFVLPKKKVDWLLTDVPCSGTGTLRRNPDAKWKIDAPLIDRLIIQQREIVAESLQYLKAGGNLVYVTCSLLPEENEDQVKYFLANHPLELVGEPISLLPQEGGMDGFFAASFKKQTLL